MLSRLVNKNVVRSSLKMSRMVKPDRYVCFCGCVGGKQCGMNMTQVAKRNFQDHLNLDSTFALLPQTVKDGEQVELWKEIKQGQDKSLILKSDDEIESYVLSVVKNYFRCTKKASVTIDSKFTDHGLDSLDTIELVIQIEDELGYLIDAEKLELFNKPKHFVNFIAQMEAYRNEHSRLPHEGIYEDFSVGKQFPGLPSLGH